MAKDFDIYSNDDGEVEVHDARHYGKPVSAKPNVVPTRHVPTSDVDELRKEVMAALDNHNTQRAVLQQTLDRVESKINRIVGLDDSGELFARLVGELSMVMGEDYIDIECDGDVIKGVRVLKAQVDEQEEMRLKAMARLKAELERKPTKRERLVEGVQWLVYDSVFARFFEIFQ
jgi:hypothetical protein